MTCWMDARSAKRVKADELSASAMLMKMWSPSNEIAPVFPTLRVRHSGGWVGRTNAIGRRSTGRKPRLASCAERSMRTDVVEIDDPARDFRVSHTIRVRLLDLTSYVDAQGER
jgi:hypothetical protein